MMKKILFSLLMLFATASAFAQGPLDFLKSENRINITIDYSETSIAGYDERTILDFEEDWVNDQGVLFSKLTDNFNKLIGPKLPGGRFEKARYTIIFRPITISQKGDMIAYAVVVRTDNQEELYRTNTFVAEGGRFGSFLNLVGDGMRSAGKTLAIRIDKAMVKKEKKSK